MSDVLTELSGTIEYNQYNPNEFNEYITTNYSMKGRVVTDYDELCALIYEVYNANVHIKRLMRGITDATPPSVPFKAVYPIARKIRIRDDEDGIAYIYEGYTYTLNQAVKHFSQLLRERYSNK